jgi:aryl-alcohol dehydrogenase-like predicted oxidoreductase
MITIDANGARIPALGLGTYRLLGDDCRRMLEAALALGYRHLDTATIYENEESVGQALARTSTRRDQIFLTTKVWVDSFRADAFERSVADSLRSSVDWVNGTARAPFRSGSAGWCSSPECLPYRRRSASSERRRTWR